MWGRATSLRMLTTLLAPTSGSATVAGCDVRTDPGGVRRRIGSVGQGNGAGHAFRVRDELVDQGRSYGMPRAQARARTTELLEALELTDLADRRVQTLSGGQRRRLDVALGLVHRPGLLFLDEPSTGLDPQSRANLWEHVLRMRRESGMTVFLTTHYLEEADTMAERVLVMDHGRVIADDTASGLKAALGDRIELEVDDPAAAVEAVGRSADEVTVAGRQLVLRVADGPALLPRLLAGLAAAGVPVQAANALRPTLDDVFLSLTGRSLRDGAGAVTTEES
jgi:ABC-2 type transport system ATP-binding protein